MMSDFTLLVLVIFSNILVTGSFLPLAYFLVAILHELGHLIAMKTVGKKIEGVRFVGFGIQIQNGTLLSYKEEILISLAGPMANIVLAAALTVVFVFIDVPWVFNLIITNLCFAILNLLPLPPLDGYKVCRNLIHEHYAYYKAAKITRVVIAVTISILSMFCLALLYFKIYNFSLILIFLLLIFNGSISMFSG